MDICFKALENSLHHKVEIVVCSIILLNFLYVCYSLSIISSLALAALPGPMT